MTRGILHGTRRLVMPHWSEEYTNREGRSHSMVSGELVGGCCSSPDPSRSPSFPHGNAKRVTMHLEAYGRLLRLQVVSVGPHKAGARRRKTCGSHRTLVWAFLVALCRLRAYSMRRTCKPTSIQMQMLRAHHICAAAELCSGSGGFCELPTNERCERRFLDECAADRLGER